MIRQGCSIIILLMISPLLSSCLGGVWTGATLVYDRHHVYKKLNDYQLTAQANHILFDDRIFKQAKCSLDLAVFNGDVLLAGHVPTMELRHLATQRLRALHGYRKLIDQVQVSTVVNHGFEDSWLTTKIRSEIFADSSIDPNAFKIITVDKIVYIMGDVRPRQANQVINIARRTAGVVRVVKIMRYLNLTEEPMPNG